jgi:hypothetical protein
MGFGHGYPIADEAYDLEVFQLACTFAASKELARLGATNRSIDRLRGIFEQSEAARRLIAVAVMVRSKLDARSVVRPNQIEKIASMNVGGLTEDLEHARQKGPLQFRAACNKIIHATSLDLMARAGSEEAESADVLSLTITLWGTRNSAKGEWQAELDLPRFSKAASRL